MYSTGGCYIVTSRILIVDLLRENIDPNKICGTYIVYDLHRIHDGLLYCIKHKRVLPPRIPDL